MIKEILQYIISLPVLLYYRLKELINPKETQNNDTVTGRLSPGEIAVPRHFLNVEYLNNEIFGLAKQLNLQDQHFLERVSNVQNTPRKRRRVSKRNNKASKKGNKKTKSKNKTTRKTSRI